MGRACSSPQIVEYYQGDSVTSLNTEHVASVDTVPDAYIQSDKILKPIKGAIRLMFGSVWARYTNEHRAIGNGLSGRVMLASRWGRYFAVKTFKKKGNNAWFYNEANLYLRMDHPNIARLIEVYEDYEHMSLVMEYCSGGELFDHLVHRTSYDDADGVHIVKQMVYAIQYLHSRNVVHRDLKLENWVYSSQHDNVLKLIDFGLSRKLVSSGSRMRRFCGTQLYMCPEILQGMYTKSCDMWSLGVLVYMVLTGAPPFSGSAREVDNRILCGTFNESNKQWIAASPLAKDFVRRLLVVHPKERMTIEEAMEHRWISEYIDTPLTIDEGALMSMRRFANAHKFQRAALSVMSVLLVNDETEGMRDVFLSLSTSKAGAISFKQFFDIYEEHSNLLDSEIKSIFKSMTYPGERDISYTGFLAAMLIGRLSYSDSVVRSAFEKFDLNNNGVVTCEDLKAVLGDEYYGVTAEELIEDFDTTGDGTINYEEFWVAVTGTSISRLPSVSTRTSTIT